MLERIQGGNAAFDRRCLSAHTFVYIWAEDIYLKVGWNPDDLLKVLQM